MRSETATRGFFDPLGELAPLEESTMSKRSHGRHGREGRRRHSHRSSGSDDDDAAGPARDASLLADLDASLLTDEERAFEEARGVAEEKVRLYREVAKLAIIVVPLLIFIPWVGGLVFFFGGISLARKAYRLFYEPQLRDRLIGDEVRKRHPELDAGEVDTIATRIAVGALRYYMLRYTRNRVVAFDLDAALSFEGETGPYLQYSVVRARNILAKVADRFDAAAIDARSAAMAARSASSNPTGGS